MGIKYGNESQFSLFAPDCGFFADHAAVHYAILVYTPIVQTFSIVVNTLIIFVLIGGGESNKLLQQTQHVYVLGSAVTNVLLSSIGILGFWVDQFVIPCVAKNFTLCAFKNLFQFSGGYQIVFNVCLVCYDRYRLVTLGTQYDHKREVNRAKWLLVGTSFVSAMLFVIPEITTPMITGQISQPMGPGDYTRCLSSALQNVSFLFGHNLADIIGILMVFGPLAFILLFTTLTGYKLYRAQSKAAASTTDTYTSQLADSRKLIRASLIMFGMVAALLSTWGPYAIFLMMIEFDPARWFDLMTLMILIVLLDTAPALDPFVFALSLPKVRARARLTSIGRLITAILTLRITNTVNATSMTKKSTAVGAKPVNSVAAGSTAAARTLQIRSANKAGFVAAPQTNQAEHLAVVSVM